MYVDPHVSIHRTVLDVLVSGVVFLSLLGIDIGNSVQIV